MYSNQTTITFQCNSEMISIGSSVYNDRDLIFIRVCKKRQNGETYFTQRGISLDFKCYLELLNGIKELGKFLGEERIVSMITKNALNEVWIKSTWFTGDPRIDIRTYFFNGVDFIPTRKGISIPIDYYPQLLDSIERLGDRFNFDELDYQKAVVI